MEFILEILNTYGREIVGAIFTALAGVLGMVASKLATKYVNTKIKRQIARTVVRGIEQAYMTLDGPAKLDKGLKALADMLQAESITVTDLELRMLLEDALGEFNDVFNYEVMEGFAVEDLDDDQLRQFLQMNGFAYTAGMTREEMLAALGEEPEAGFLI